MNWKCELVMDLAPLYYDGVASRVSKRLVKSICVSARSAAPIIKNITP